MQQLQQALVVVTLALGATSAAADTHAPAPAAAHAAPTANAPTKKPAAKKGIPTKTPMASSNSPSLAQLVALGKDAAPAAVVAPAADAVHADAPAVDAHVAPAHAAPAEGHADGHAADAHAADAHAAEPATEGKAAVPAFPSSTSPLPPGITGQATPASTPWGAIAFFVALIGGAIAVWFKKKQGIKASGGPLLTVRESTSIGPRRQLLVVDVGGRRVLLSSSEAGVGLLLDCGPVSDRDGLVHAAGNIDGNVERFFGDALVKAVRQDRQEPAGGLQLVNAQGQPLPAPPAFSAGFASPPTSSSSMPSVTMANTSGPVRKNEAEAAELMRRLGR
ncbi:MAG TPA: flagellar biosynthetic protein FliO [Myxococcota bacterium]